MRSFKLFVVALLATATVSTWADEHAVQEVPPAEQLFRTAMKFELEGDNNYRNMTLRAIVAEDAQFAKARWHLGEILRDGDWHPVRQAINDSDPILIEYGKRRQKAFGDPTEEWALAKWCRANKLVDRERLHLMRVVAHPTAEPAMRESAAQRLKLTSYGGQWVSEEQVEAWKKQEAEVVRDYKQWAPRVAKWRDAIESSSERKRNQAISELANVDEPGAVLALEVELSAHGQQWALLAVKSLGNIAHHDATKSLVRHALGAPWPNVVDAAAEELKKRPMHEYVPDLLSALDTPTHVLTTRAYVNPLGNSVVQRQFFVKEGMDSNQLAIVNRFATAHQVINPNMEYELSQARGNHFLGPDRKQISDAEVNQLLANEPELQRAIKEHDSLDPNDLSAKLVAINNRLTSTRAGETLSAAATFDAARLKQEAAKVAIENERIAASNARTFRVLKITTQQILPNKATDWWDWWDEYNEVASVDTDYRTGYPMNDRKPTSVTAYNSWKNYTYESSPITVVRRSCFATGTPVWTDTGVRPIESVLVGDRVLAQDPDSGELSFVVVTEHTLRPPTEIMQIKVGDETIACTKGHPFWIVGTGWKMAKLIESGDAVHGIDGGHAVQSVAFRVAEDEAHNLVVAGFGTYFVGNQGLLVHDNTYRAPTRAVIPGYVYGERLAVADRP